MVEDAGDEEEDDENDMAPVKKLVEASTDRLEGKGGEDGEETPSLRREKNVSEGRRKEGKGGGIRRRQRRICTTPKSGRGPSVRRDPDLARADRTTQLRERSRKPR